LGKRGEGRTDPVDISVKRGRGGVGVEDAGERAMKAIRAKADEMVAMKGSFQQTWRDKAALKDLQRFLCLRF
jgi:hypothetical protein